MRLVLRTMAFVICGIATAGNAADNRESFNLAQAHYRDGDYAGAAQLLSAQSQAEVGPGLLHNLGNAEFKLGHVGEAILAWERARSLAPWARNTAGNLRFARREAALDQPSFPWYETYSMWLTPDTWLWSASICFWGAIACLALPSLLHRRRTGLTQVGAVVTISAFILIMPALAGLWTRSKIGVVLASETPLRLTPTEEGEVLGKLPAGELARIELQRRGYFYVRAESDRAGWVDQQEFARIWNR
jgi:tetratricopeptide (TPR) repeat protein